MKLMPASRALAMIRDEGGLLTGAPVYRLILNEYMLFVMPLTLATLIGNMAWVTGMEVTLAYLGLTNVTLPTLGIVLHFALNNQAILLGLYWWILAPVGAAVALFVALYLLSQSFSDFLDPRARIPDGHTIEPDQGEQLEAHRLRAFVFNFEIARHRSRAGDARAACRAASLRRGGPG